MKHTHSRWLVIVGLILMIVGVVDPLEGSVVILAGSLLVAVGALLSRSRSRLPVAALILNAIGIGAMFGLSALGGVGGSSGYSIWWLVLCVPYPVGWILGLVGAVYKLRERPTATA